MATLHRPDGPVGEGQELVLDHNYFVTIVHVIPPYDDDDLGSVQVKHNWGEIVTVNPGRLGAWIQED
ncbi:hypothetical protein OG530_19230 [Streptomyces decoyicus]|uniref:hypothetical protein n=1 Tax=Streptomyces decoyicus TaxID=249567 RepID=UPI002E17C486